MSALFWLALTAGLGAILWIPVVVGNAIHNGLPGAAEYRDPALAREKLSSAAWLRRADRVLTNYLEVVVPFAVLVLIAHLRLARPEPTMYADVALWAQVFFWSRLAHAVIYWFGIPYLRTLAFLGGFAATVAIFLIVLGNLT